MTVGNDTLCACHVCYGVATLNQTNQCPSMCPTYITLICYIPVFTFILCIYKYIPVHTGVYRCKQVHTKYPVLVHLVTIPDALERANYYATCPASHCRRHRDGPGRLGPVAWQVQRDPALTWPPQPGSHRQCLDPPA
jgi:hypothetical protein